MWRSVVLSIAKLAPTQALGKSAMDVHAPAPSSLSPPPCVRQTTLIGMSMVILALTEMTYEGRSTGLTSLSPELILRVIDHSDSQSRCRWPAPRNTSPTAAAASSTAIRLPTGSTASHPTWILRSVLGYEDPFEPWHVRSFEIWGARDSWDECGH